MQHALCASIVEPTVLVNEHYPYIVQLLHVTFFKAKKERAEGQLPSALPLPVKNQYWISELQEFHQGRKTLA